MRQEWCFSNMLSKILLSIFASLLGDIRTSQGGISDNIVSEHRHGVTMIYDCWNHYKAQPKTVPPVIYPLVRPDTNVLKLSPNSSPFEIKTQWNGITCAQLTFPKITVIAGKCINNRTRGRSWKGMELIVYCLRMRHLWGRKSNASNSIPLRLYMYPEWSAILLGRCKNIASDLIMDCDGLGGFLVGAWEWFQQSYIIVTPCLWSESMVFGLSRYIVRHFLLGPCKRLSNHSIRMFLHIKPNSGDTIWFS